MKSPIIPHRLTAAVTAGIALVLFCGWTSATQATLVKSSVNGVLIDDGFESYATGLLNSNVGQPWSLQNPSRVFVESTLGAPNPPVANQGTKYLWLASASGAAAAYQTFGTAQTTGVLTANFAFWLNNTSDPGDGALFGNFLKGTAAQQAASLGSQFESDIGFVTPKWITVDLGSPFAPDGSGKGEVAYFGTGGWQFLQVGGVNAHFTLGAWHLARIDDNIGTGALTVSIDGTQLDALSANPFETSSVTGFTFYDNSQGGYAFADDVVPEPSTILLLLTGGLGLWRWRAKKRG